MRRVLGTSGSLLCLIDGSHRMERHILTEIELLRRVLGTSGSLLCVIDGSHRMERHILTEIELLHRKTKVVDLRI